MDSMLRTMTIFLSCMVLGSIAFFVIVNYFVYRRNVKRLNASIDSVVTLLGVVEIRYR